MVVLEHKFYNTVSVWYVKCEFICNEMKILGICRSASIVRDHKNYHCITSQ
jgi:hypothetical protein